MRLARVAGCGIAVFVLLYKGCIYCVELRIGLQVLLDIDIRPRRAAAIDAYRWRPSKPAIEGFVPFVSMTLKKTQNLTSDTHETLQYAVSVAFCAASKVPRQDLCCAAT